MNNISDHITYDEATVSQTSTRLHIDNTPDEHILINMKVVAMKCFEPARAHFGPIKVDSFYRCDALNKAVGGAPTSQHKKGEAIDMSLGSKERNKELFDWCKANLIFDQLLWEYGDDTGPAWVHISFSLSGNRNQTIRIK